MNGSESASGGPVIELPSRSLSAEELTRTGMGSGAGTPFSFQASMPDLDHASALYRQFLEALGVDTSQPSLRDTPMRVSKMLADLLTPADFEPTTFENDGSYDSLVVLRDIPFYSLCEHHVVPFYGVAHVGYLPNGKVIGLSKLARFVEKHARSLQVQERMTTRIAADVIQATGSPTVGVVIEARHLCVEMRGVKKPGAITKTNVMLGELRANASLKAEFMDAID